MTTKNEKNITAIKTNMRLIEVTIVGTTPMLQHRFTESAEQAKGTRRVQLQQEEPRVVAERAAHRDSDGNCYFPGAAISRLLREAGGAHKMRGSRKSLKYILPAAVLVLEDAVILHEESDREKPLTTFEVDSRPVVIPATKGRVMRHRPRFDKWAASFTLRINESVLDEDTIAMLLNEGGSQIGLGDFRPEKGGPFGTFRIVSWVVKSESKKSAA